MPAKPGTSGQLPTATTQVNPQGNIPAPPPSPGTNYVGTRWQHKTMPAYYITVKKQFGSTALPALPGDTLMTVEGNIGFPRTYCLDLETISAQYNFVKKPAVNAPEALPVV